MSSLTHYLNYTIAEFTSPANRHDSVFLIPLLKKFHEKFNLNIEAVIADSAFDSSSILSFIINDLNATPIISKNPRKNAYLSSNISSISDGIPLCIAGFKMVSHGIYFDKIQQRTRHKFICPIKGSKKFSSSHPSCPWNHPKFLANRFGCVVNLKINPDIRKSIDYSSKSFKELYNLRSSVERIFSRLLSICMQDSSVKGLKSISNICTIAHITILSVALLASTSGNSDKIRFIKKFFQDS